MWQRTVARSAPNRAEVCATRPPSPRFLVRAAHSPIRPLARTLAHTSWSVGSEGSFRGLGRVRGGSRLAPCRSTQPTRTARHHTTPAGDTTMMPYGFAQRVATLRKRASTRRFPCPLAGSRSIGLPLLMPRPTPAVSAGRCLARLSLGPAGRLDARPGDSTLARSLLRSVGRAGRAGRASCGARTVLRKRAAPHRSPRDPFAPPSRSTSLFSFFPSFFSLFLLLSSVLWRPVRAVAVVEVVVAEVSPACGWRSSVVVVELVVVASSCHVTPRHARITRHASNCPTTRCMEPQLLRDGRQHERAESSLAPLVLSAAIPEPAPLVLSSAGAEPAPVEGGAGAPAPPSAVERGLKICVGA